MVSNTDTRTVTANADQSDIEVTFKNGEKNGDESKPMTNGDAEEEREIEQADIDELFAKGKRHFICNDIQAAIPILADVCEMLENKYGQMAVECAEAFMFYGKALLEMARIEDNVLGHAVKEGPVGDDDAPETEDVQSEEEIDEKERKELKKQVVHALTDGNHYNQDNAGDVVTDEEQTADEEEEAAEDKENKAPPAGEGSSTGQGASTDVDMEGGAEQEGEEGEEDPGEQTEDEDVSNMQLSWEMFEVVANIYKKQAETSADKMHDAKMKIAEAKIELGHIGLETDHYEQAVSDFKEALELQKETLPEDDRRIAGSYYNVGVALNCDKKFEEALQWFKRAVDTLETRVKNLEEKIKKAEAEGGKDKASAELEEWTKEVDELRDLLVLDMMAKIEDTEVSKKQHEESLKAMKTMAKEVLGSVASAFDQGFGDAEGFGESDAWGKPSNEEVQMISTTSIRKKDATEQVQTISSTNIKRKDSTEKAAENQEAGKKRKLTDDEESDAKKKAKADTSTPITRAEA